MAAIGYQINAADTAAAPGTGAATLTGTVPTAGFASFLSLTSRLANGETGYAIMVLDSDKTKWEIFLFTYTTAGTSLARTTTVVTHAGNATPYNFTGAVSIYAGDIGVLLRCLTTKGDIQTFDGTTFARLAVGGNGKPLIADSAQSTGLGYATIDLDVASHKITNLANGSAAQDAAAFGQLTDANLSTSDITTNDVSTSKHGFAPKAPNDTTKFLRGDGTWAAPAASPLTQQTDLTATTVTDGVGTAQDIGGTITLAANTLAVGVGLLYMIEARVTTAPTGANQLMDLYACIDGTQEAKHANCWSAVTTETSAAAKRAYKYAVAISVENASGNNVDLVIVNSQANVGMYGVIFPGGSMNSAMAAAAPSTAGVPIRMTVDKTATHAFKFQVALTNGNRGCVITPAVTRLMVLTV